MSGLSNYFTAKRGAVFGALVGASVLAGCGTPSNTSYQDNANQRPDALQSGLSQVFGCAEGDDLCVRERGYQARTVLGVGLILRGYQ